MTAEEITEIGIPIENADAATILAIESALEYVKANTSLDFDMTDIDDLKALPSCVKLFAMKYTELIGRETGITSESIAGMSQSFETSDNSTLIFDLLSSLCSEYVTTQFECVPRIGRYRYGR